MPQKGKKKKKKSRAPGCFNHFGTRLFFHTSTRLQLTLKTQRPKCEHMQRTGRAPRYCRSPATRPRHRNKSLQAQVGLMWCLGLTLTSAEEWVVRTASWRVSLAAGTRKILSATAGYLQPGQLSCVTRYSRWSNGHEWHCLRSVCLGSLSLTQSLQLHSFGNTEGENGNQTLTWPFSPLSWHLCHPKESWRSTARWVQIGTMCAQMESFSCPAWRVSDKVLFLKTL